LLLLPVPISDFGFNDIGRVWMGIDSSSKWHDGYGGGIYLVPFNAVILSLVVAASGEDVLLSGGIGTKVNVTFQR
jgi:hypothetical protein